MLEQEQASIAKFILSAVSEVSEVTPYYHEIKKNFKVPSIYFPADPEVIPTPDALDSYSLLYSWFVNVFQSTTADAFLLAKAALDAIVGQRYLIPLLHKSGAATGKGIRLKDAQIKKVDNGVYQLWLSWNSCKEYDDIGIPTETMMEYQVDYSTKIE